MALLVRVGLCLLWLPADRKLTAANSKRQHFIAAIILAPINQQWPKPGTSCPEVPISFCSPLPDVFNHSILMLFHVLRITVQPSIQVAKTSNILNTTTSGFIPGFVLNLNHQPHSGVTLTSTIFN